MDVIASQITSLAIVYSMVYSDADQRQIKAPRGRVNSPHKWPVMRKMLPFDDVIMIYRYFKYDVISLKYKQKPSTQFTRLMLTSQANYRLEVGFK